MNKHKTKRELEEEIDLLDTMLSSLVELPEEKGIVTQEEYKKNQSKRRNHLAICFIISYEKV